MSKVTSNLAFDGRVLELTLDSPKANILDASMIDGLSTELKVHSGQPLRAIVFLGAGEHFSFGASVLEHTAPYAKEMLSRFHGLFRQLLEISVPTFAVVKGQCLGGGMELAAFTEAIFAAPNARFGQPEINLAVFPPMASLLLPWKIGAAFAADLCLSGRTVSAEEAQRMGLVHAVEMDPKAALDRYLVEYLLEKSAIALRYATQATRVGLIRAMRDELPKLEVAYLEGLMKSHDANEGLAAFIEKRKPRYSESFDLAEWKPANL